jgi:ribosomal protein L37AE/L43A
MPEKLRNGIPLPLRQKYLQKMYPDITRGYLELCVQSEQQREIFCRYYGFECEPQSNEAIRSALSIRCHNQVAVQLDRAEVKLGVDKDKKFDLVRALRREFYKKHRPKCPYCKGTKSQFRGEGRNTLDWYCGKCKGQFKTVGDSPKAGQRIVMSFWLDDRGTVSELVVKADGERVEVSNANLQMIVGKEDWNLNLQPLDNPVDT